MGHSMPIYLFLVSFVVLVSSVSGNPDEGLDADMAYWKKRAQEASKVNQASYIPNPYTITNSFNDAVHKALTKNSTGRSLRASYSGTCLATNPIDRCWRCRANWAENRQLLSGCAKGFGRKAHGAGKNSKIYVVTDNSDEDLINPKVGTLRWGAIQDEPLWIVFERDMVITLQQELMVAGHKTIDGRGANVEIAYGGGITIQYVTNVIIHGLHIHDIVSLSGGMIRDSLSHMGLRTRSDGDAISVFGASNVWLDHNTMSNCADGLIDIIEGSTAITVSNNLFHDHNDVMLYGASDKFDGDSIMQITVAFNHFGQNLVQRMPRVRWGFVHVVNNDYTHWLMYAIGGSMHPTIICQGNRFVAPFNPFAKEITKRDYAPESEWMKWNWTSEGDLYLNGAFFRGSGVESSRALTSNFSRHEVMKSKPGTFVTRLTRYVGKLDCVPGQPC